MVKGSGRFDLSAALKTREVRWLYHGPLPRPIFDWFIPSANSGSEFRSDLYDFASAMNGIGRKHRGTSTLDTKFRVDASPAVELAAGLTGIVEDWVKISAPLNGSKEEGLAHPFRMDKRLYTRRYFLDRAHDAGCEVELADIRAEGVEAWSLCFETFGSPELRAETFRTGIDQFVAETVLPSNVEFDADSSLSYPDWISSLGDQTV
jgi:hypothetical protein